MLIAVVIGVPLGVLAAVRADRPADQISRVVALLGVSLPAFWLAILFQLFLGFGSAGSRSPAAGVPSDAPPNLTGLYTLDSLAPGNGRRCAIRCGSSSYRPLRSVSRHGDDHAIYPGDAPRSDGAGLRPHRPGQGRRRTPGRVAPRAAQRA